ncbi:MAG: PaaI family thioesterase [Acidimicrobiia bacterium]|nr:PaaI family thioesterase [Acidimicrobiia bacterium]
MPEGLTEEKQAELRRGVIEVMPRTPFIGWLDLRFETYEPDDVVVRLPYREELTNDGTFYHGGVIAAAIDTAGAAAVWSNHDFDKGARASTVSISIQYVGAARRSDLVCRARCVKRAKELSFAEITATDQDGKTVAHALLTYRIVP